MEIMYKLVFFFQMSRREIFLSYPLFFIQAERKPTLGLGRRLGGAREIVQLIKCLPCKCKDLDLVPRAHVTMQGCGSDALVTQCWGGGGGGLELAN